MSFTKRIKALVKFFIVIGVVLLLLRFTPFRGLEKFQRSRYSIPVYSSQKTLLAVLPLDNGLRREFLSIGDFRKDLRRIILESEDRRFYFHPGFDPISLMRAFGDYLSSGEVSSGASTISMQLSRMINPRTKGIRGKLLEILDALRLELRLSKNDILEAYINHLPFGSNIEGIKSAAFYFLGKDIENLSPEELLILIMIPRRPEDYNPLEYPGANKKSLLRTAARVSYPISREKLDSLYERIGEHEPFWPWHSPHFIQMIRSGLAEEQWQSGEGIYSSLDDEFQNGAQSYLSDILEGTAENRISNGAVLAIDNETGEILAYVGSADFHNDSLEGQNDGVRILRQPGSTLKPFLYAKAIESGFSPSGPLPDIPMEFGSREIYIPENYNERYNGPVRLSVALGSSLNVPSVYLLERLGVKPFLEKLLAAGFRSLENKEDLGVGLALGNGEVSLWELVQAFSIFSRGGDFVPLTFAAGRDDVEHRNVYPQAVSEMIRNILSNNKNRILGFGRSNPLEVNFDAYFKTGTSNQFNNIWALGATQDISVGVWMGNFSGETVIGSPGSSYPARVVVSLLEDFHKTKKFVSSEKFDDFHICSLSGDLAGPYCHYVLEEKLPLGMVLETCTWHRGEEIYLPLEYARWSALYRQDFSFDQSESDLKISQPRDGSLFYLDPTLPENSQAIAIRINGRKKISLYINDKLVHEAPAPVTYYQKVEKGTFTIKAKSGSHVEEARILVK